MFCSILSIDIANDDKVKMAESLIDDLEHVIGLAVGGRDRQEILFKHWRSIREEDLRASNITFTQDNNDCIRIFNDGVLLRQIFYRE